MKMVESLSVLKYSLGWGRVITIMTTVPFVKILKSQGAFFACPNQDLAPAPLPSFPEEAPGQS